MPVTAYLTHAARADYAACSGCTLCAPVCPVWRDTRDLRMSPEGRCKALQHGAAIADISRSLAACTLCGACEPVCPENIDLLGTVRRLSKQLPESPGSKALIARLKAVADGEETMISSHTLLIPGFGLRAQPELLKRALHLLGAGASSTLSDEVSLALDAGVDVPASLLEQFLAPLSTARQIIVGDAALVAPLRAWLPRSSLSTLGERLSGLPACRALMDASDLYLIDSRAYHADYDRLVLHYHRLREERGIQLNLDLQRIAIPASARSLSQRLGEAVLDDETHVRWLLKGRKVSRVIAENIDDLAAIKRHTGLPAIHIAELARTAADMNTH